jgi:hypothetical protein
LLIGSSAINHWHQSLFMALQVPMRADEEMMRFQISMDSIHVKAEEQIQKILTTNKSVGNVRQRLLRVSMTSSKAQNGCNGISAKQIESRIPSKLFTAVYGLLRFSGGFFLVTTKRLRKCL